MPQCPTCLKQFEVEHWIETGHADIDVGHSHAKERCPGPLLMLLVELGDKEPFFVASFVFGAAKAVIVTASQVAASVTAKGVAREQ